MIASQIRVAASEHVRVGLSFLGHLFFPSVSPAPALWFGADAHLCWLFRMNADRRCRVMHVCLFSVWLCQSEYLKLNASGNNVQRPRKKKCPGDLVYVLSLPIKDAPETLPKLPETLPKASQDVTF